MAHAKLRYRPLHLWSLICLLGLALAPARALAWGSGAEPLPVAPAATASDRTVGSAPCTYRTIQAALDEAVYGDRLLLEGGVTFQENIAVARGVTLVGGYTGCGSGSSTRTTIDGGGEASVVKVMVSSQTVALRNLNLTNGRSNAGGGVYAQPSAVLTLQNVVISHNTSLGSGGGMYVSVNAVVTGTLVSLLNNTAVDGGGVYLYDGRLALFGGNIYDNAADRGAGVSGVDTNQSATRPRLDLYDGVNVHGNDAITGSGYGGGIYMAGGVVTVQGWSDIFSNSALVGGGVYLTQNGDTLNASTLTIEGAACSIGGNTAGQSGGGIYAGLGSTVTLNNGARLADNTATTNGGGAFLDDSTLNGNGAAIVYNTASTGSGGGIAAINSSSVDLDPGPYPCHNSRCSELSHNTSLSTGGGLAAASSVVNLDRTMVEANTGSVGGGIYLNLSDAWIYNLVVAHNNATGGSGDGIYVDTESALTGSHLTIAYNDLGGEDTGVGVTVAGGGDVVLTDSIIWGHETSISSDSESVTCSDIQGGYTGTGNIALNPLFASASEGDFHLRLTGLMGLASPAIDKCAAGRVVDFESQPRPAALYRASTPYDMGADEVWEAIFLPLALRNK